MLLDAPALAAPPEVPPVVPEFGLFVDDELDTEVPGVDGVVLADPDVDVAVVGWSVVLGAVVGPHVAVPVIPSISLPLVALRLAFAESALGELVVPVAVAVLVAVAVPVAVLVAVAVPVAVVVLVGVAVPELAGVAFGVTDLPGSAVADVVAAAGEEVDGHAVALGLLWPLVVLPGLLAPLDEPPNGLEPVPARLGVPLLLFEMPATWPIWTRASRVGGSARATPTANTAHATARAGRSNPSRQSRGRRRASPAPSRPGPVLSRSSRPAFQRSLRAPRKPPTCPTPACLLAWADPDRTRARIRSRPSGPGSTWSAAACRAWRR